MVVEGRRAWRPGYARPKDDPEERPMPEQDPALNAISKLADEEHELREREGSGDGPLPEADRLRLAEVELQLDRYWDLLRQRRARRNAGLNPDEAAPRDIDTVEDYQQ
jgi:hypothetical protein